MALALRTGRRALLGALLLCGLAGGLACVAIAAEPEGDPLERLLSRQEIERKTLIAASPAFAAMVTTP